MKLRSVSNSDTSPGPYLDPVRMAFGIESSKLVKGVGDFCSIVLKASRAGCNEVGVQLQVRLFGNCFKRFDGVSTSIKYEVRMLLLLQCNESADGDLKTLARK